jgi:AcrR family transcriptional regulator
MHPMAGVRQARAEDTRQRVVAAARRLFAEQGYFETGTTEIVDAAGVGTRGALYHHFESKQALFLAVFEAIEVDLVAKVGVTVSGDTRLERLERALSAFLDASLDPEVRRVMLIDGPAVLGWAGWREIEARYGLGAIRQMVGDGIAEGSIVEVDENAMAHLLLSVIDEAALFIAHADDPAAARVTTGASVAALIAGLAPR